jgi:hypothetical protein
MKNFLLVGYLDNNLANTFLIPIYSNGSEYFFQFISADNSKIVAFDKTDDLRISEYLRKYSLKESERKIFDEAFYLFRFQNEIFGGTRYEALSKVGGIFKYFNPDTNLFFIKDLIQLYKTEKANLIKYFFHINHKKFLQKDLIDYMCIVFSLEETKLFEHLKDIRLDKYYNSKNAEYLKSILTNNSIRKPIFGSLVKPFIDTPYDEGDKIFYNLV